MKPENGFKVVSEVIRVTDMENDLNNDILQESEGNKNRKCLSSKWKEAGLKEYLVMGIERLDFITIM